MRHDPHLGFRHWVTPRAMLLHLGFLVIAAGCLAAGWWQVQRAMQGNTLSYLYSFEWPAFVVVAGIGWFQMARDTPEDIEQRRRFRAQMRVASAEVVARTLPRSALAIEVDSTQTSGRVLGPAERRRALTDGAGAGSSGAPLALRPETTVVAEATLVPDATGLPADEMTDYNRYLAVLAVKGKAKTWRNPRGL